jgi:hypothetical protein
MRKRAMQHIQGSGGLPSGELYTLCGNHFMQFAIARQLLLVSKCICSAFADPLRLIGIVGTKAESMLSDQDL